MGRSIRLAVAVCAGLVALAFAGSAWAAYTPRLIALTSSFKPSGPTTIVLGHTQDVNDDATFKDTIYAPLGYQATLTQAVNTKIGVIDATLVLRQGGNTQVAVKGTVAADDPANYPPATNQCTPGQPQHEAVWRADVTVAGTPLHVPIYVDHVTTAPENTFASVKIQLCLAGPIGTPAGAQLLFAIFDVKGVFTNPSTTTPHVWHAKFTPYVAGTPNPNPAGTTEGQALVPGRVSLTLTVKRLKHGNILLQGRLLVDGSPVSGETVELGVGKHYVGSKKVASTTTNGSGRFTFRKRIRKKTIYHGLVTKGGDLPSCPAPGIGAPQGCTSATITYIAASNGVLARPKK